MPSVDTSIVVPGIASNPRWPDRPRRSRNARWSRKIDGSSPSITLRWKSSGSRKHGGPALGTTAVAPTASTYRIARANWLSTLASTSGRSSPGGRSYTIGYQIAPLYCSQCRSTGPWARSASRSVVRQSFWSTMRASPSLTTTAESPPGPSVMLVSTWIATVSPSRSSSSPSTVRMMFVNPSPWSRRSTRVSGSPGPACRVAWQVLAYHGSSRWSPWRWETYRLSAASMPRSARRATGRCGGTGTRTEERRDEPRVADDRARATRRPFRRAERRGAHRRLTPSLRFGAVREPDGTRDLPDFEVRSGSAGAGASALRRLRRLEDQATGGSRHRWPARDTARSTPSRPSSAAQATRRVGDQPGGTAGSRRLPPRPTCVGAAPPPAALPNEASGPPRPQWLAGAR